MREAFKSRVGDGNKRGETDKGSEGKRLEGKDVRRRRDRKEKDSVTAGRHKKRKLG